MSVISACLSLFMLHNRNTIVWVNVNNRNLFLTVWETGSPRSRCQHDRVLVRTLFWVAKSWFLVVSSQGRRDKGSLSASFIRALIPFLKALPS